MKRGTALKLEFVRRGLVQADVAHGAKMSESRLSRIVNGRVEPAANEVARIANVLGLPLEELPGWDFAKQLHATEEVRGALTRGKLPPSTEGGTR